MLIRSLCVALLATMTFAAPALAQRGDRGVGREVGRSLDTTLALARDGTVDLSNVSGRITVTSANRAEVRIRARLTTAGTLLLDASGSRVTLGVRSDRGRMGEATYDVVVPTGARVITNSVSGDISLRGPFGPVEARSVSGDIDVSDTQRLTVQTVSGDATVRNVTGNVSAASVSGDVRVTRMTGDLVVESVSGDVTMDDIRSESVRGTTVSGDVRYQGTVSPRGRYEMRSHSGDVRLVVPANIGAVVTAETFSGALRSDFQMTLQPGEVRGGSRRRMEFTIGQGDARITLNSFSGNIVINRAGARAQEE
jgi:DUF4097 and DUF4098 domain-containing protein YvlB